MEAVGAGRGYASIAIADGKIYTLGDGLSTAKDADEYLTCFDATSGKHLWAAKTGGAWADRKPDWAARAVHRPSTAIWCMFSLPKEFSTASTLRVKRSGRRI